MKRECDKCGKPATVHLTEIADGEKIEKHLCEDYCGLGGHHGQGEPPISQLLEDFILQSAGREDTAELRCDVCGLTFSEFRQRGVLGCPNDYDAFSRRLDPMLKQAQEGGRAAHGQAAARARRRPAEGSRPAAEGELQEGDLRGKLRTGGGAARPPQGNGRES